MKTKSQRPTKADYIRAMIAEIDERIKKNQMLIHDTQIKISNYELRKKMLEDKL